MKLLLGVLSLFSSVTAFAAAEIPNCFDRGPGKLRGRYLIALEGANANTLGHFLRFSSPTEAFPALRPATSILVDGRFFFYVLESTDLSAKDAQSEAEEQLKFLLSGIQLTPKQQAKVEVSCADEEKYIPRLEFDAPKEIRDDAFTINVKTRKPEFPECASGQYRLWRPYNAFLERGEPAWKEILKLASKASHLKTLTFPIEDENVTGYYRFEVSVSPTHPREAREELKKISDIPTYISCVEKSPPVPRQ